MMEKTNLMKYSILSLKMMCKSENCRSNLILSVIDMAVLYTAKRKRISSYIMAAKSVSAEAYQPI
jgi:hypothetical protein